MRFFAYFTGWGKFARLQRQGDKAIASLAARENELITAQANVERRIQAALVEVRNAGKLLSQYKDELEAARSELDVCKNTTIPALAAAHDLLIARFEADTAAHQRRALMLGAAPIGAEH